MYQQAATEVNESRRKKQSGNEIVVRQKYTTKSK